MWKINLIEWVKERKKMNNIDKCLIENKTDDAGNPTGGLVNGVGLNIIWQDGPLGRGPERVEPNGAFVETVIDACRKRLEFYQDSRFKCKANELAIIHLSQALAILNDRTRQREARGVEGTHAE